MNDELILLTSKRCRLLDMRSLWYVYTLYVSAKVPEPFISKKLVTVQTFALLMNQQRSAKNCLMGFSV